MSFQHCHPLEKNKGEAQSYVSVQARDSTGEGEGSEHVGRYEFTRQLQEPRMHGGQKPAQSRHKDTFIHLTISLTVSRFPHTQ